MLILEAIRNTLIRWEMGKNFGVVIAMAVSPATCIDDYWSTEDNNFMSALKFKEKAGMSKNRWEEMRSLHWFSERETLKLHNKWRRMMNGIIL